MGQIGKDTDTLAVEPNDTSGDVESMRSNERYSILLMKRIFPSYLAWNDIITPKTENFCSVKVPIIPLFELPCIILLQIRLQLHRESVNSTWNHC